MMRIPPAGLLAGAKISEATLVATVTRADGTVEHLGTIAYFSPNPLKRLAWRIGRWLRGDFV
jgi:hypothetical protein